METLLIKNALLVNKGEEYHTDVLIKDGRIHRIDKNIGLGQMKCKEIPADGLHLLPGVIDDQVHFREPGLTHKACIETESAAAVAGGITSFMEMPNTNPPALTRTLLEEKYAIAQRSAYANYSFFMGVSNHNKEEVLRCNEAKDDICGIKIFMGSSTGDMLVDDTHVLSEIFSNAEMLIATHCEDEPLINERKLLFPNADHASFHPLIRNEEVCLRSSSLAVALAKKYNTRLHILHISTAEELGLFQNDIPLADKRITSEVCVHHLHFTADDYEIWGNKIKCNPAIKKAENRNALWDALLDNRLDIIATDHAPHLLSEKELPYQQAPAGLPLVQHALPLMLHYVQQGKISLKKVVEKMSHAPAICFQLAERGFLEEGFYADAVLVNMQQSHTANDEELLYRCGWSPFAGFTFPATIKKTLVNGCIVYEDGKLTGNKNSKRLRFNRSCK